MNIIEACKAIFEDRELYAKRKSWNNSMITVMQIGWANQYERTEQNEVDKIIPSKNYIQLIQDNLMKGSVVPDLDDVLADDWEVFNR